MKNVLPSALLLLLGISLSACGPKETPSAADKAGNAIKDAAAKTGDAIESAATKTKDAAVAAGDAIGDKLREWKLTPADLKEDLAKGGRIVRSKSAAATEKAGTMIDNARLVTVINGKYVADRDLSSFKINVDADNGVVTLRGSVKSPELLGRAMGLALDTDGVRQVISTLTVEP